MDKLELDAKKRNVCRKSTAVSKYYTEQTWHFHSNFVPDHHAPGAPNSQKCVIADNHISLLPDLDCVLEDVPRAGGGDELGDGGVVPHDEEAQLVLVDPLLVAVVHGLLRLKINIQ